MPLSFYNNLVHQLHLLYIFFFSRKLVFFWCSLFFGYCASWIEPDYLKTWSGEFSVSTFTLVPNETSAHLTVSWNVVIRFGDVLPYSGYISSDFLRKQLQCCPGSGGLILQSLRRRRTPFGVCSGQWAAQSSSSEWAVCSYTVSSCGLLPTQRLCTLYSEIKA